MNNTEQQLEQQVAYLHDAAQAESVLRSKAEATIADLRSQLEAVQRELKLVQNQSRLDTAERQEAVQGWQAERTKREEAERERDAMIDVAQALGVRVTEAEGRLGEALAALALFDRMRLQLEKHEFIGGWEGYACPECGIADGQEHQQGCELKTILAEVDALAEEKE